MSIHDPSSGDIPETARAVAAAGGQASGQHQGLHRPSDDRRVEQALEHVGLEDLGDVLEDQWRDRRSRGAPPPQDPQPGRNDAAPD